jgi:acetyl esterase
MITQQRPYLVEPKAQAFIDALSASGGKPIQELSYEEARKVLESLQAGHVTALPADVEEKVLPVGPTGHVGPRTP